MADNQQEQQVKLEASGFVTSAGRFEIDAITAGEGNGWLFTAEVLKDSLQLWEGANCFIDHSFWGGRSIRDLAGVFHNPTWVEETKGVRLELQTMGPCGPLVEELGRQVLKESVKPRIGFSADIVFSAVKNEVRKILRVIELDLVFNPARGGAFVRALNSQGYGGVVMGKEEEAAKTANNPTNGRGAVADSPTTGRGAVADSPLSVQLQKDAEAVRSLLGHQEERQKLAAEAEAARAVRLQMCQYLLDFGLNASKLPAPMAEHVRKQFESKIFEPAELNAAIDSARALVSDLTGGKIIAGPTGRVHSMFSSEDQLQAAVDDMLDAPREKKSEGVKVARLSGIKELYMMLTGDRDLYGGYYADRIQLATTANFTGLVKNAMNKVVAAQWEQLGAAGYDWWRKIVQIEHFETLNAITGVLVGTVGALPSVAEGAEYTELKIGDSPETASFTKYGGYIPLTLELIDRDDTRKLRLYPRELAKAGLRKISALVAAVFTDNAAVGPTLADGGALFNATAVTTAGGHANLLTTALSAAQWETVKAAMFKQPLLIANETGYLGTGSRAALKPALYAGSARARAHRRQDPLRRLGEYHQHPRRQPAEAAHGRRPGSARMDRRHRLGRCCRSCLEPGHRGRRALRPHARDLRRRRRAVPRRVHERRTPHQSAPLRRRPGPGLPPAAQVQRVTEKLSAIMLSARQFGRSLTNFKLLF